MEGKPGNALLRKWLPQQDVLGMSTVETRNERLEVEKQ